MQNVFVWQRDSFCRMTFTILMFMFSTASFHLLLFAQVVGATLTGTVLDPSGAKIPTGTVSIKNTGTASDSVVHVDSDGYFSASNLQAGNYEVSFTAPGFDTQVIPGIVLTVGETRILNAKMVVGAVQNVVTVTDNPTDIQLADSTIGGVNGEKTIKELPLNGRSWTDLVDLQPGVFAVRTQPGISTRDRPNRGYGQQFSISGNRPNGNNYRLDGISINDPTNGGPGSVLGGNLGVDAIVEFSVLTANYSAAYGRASGGVLNAITKSGDNSLHGSAYEFLRNSALDARNYFDPGTIPPFKRNQFGASLGAPIRKDKTFAYGDYEGLRQTLSLSKVDIVPTAAARNGSLVGGNVTVDPQAARFLSAFYPLPNEPISGPSDTGIFAFALPQITTENFFIIRLDHALTSRDSLHGTYMYDFANVNQTDEFKNKSLPIITHRQLVTAEDSHTFSPRFLNSFRLGYNRFFSGAGANSTALNPAVTDLSYGFVPGETAGRIIIPGQTQFTGGLSAVAPALYRWNSYQLYDEAIYSKGRHTLKFGGSFEQDRANESTEPRPGGYFIFGSLNGFLTNQPIALATDFAHVQPERNIRQSIYGLYVVDDIKMKPNLTLNLGMRYEPTTVPREINGRSSTLLTLLGAQPHLGAPLFNNNTYRNLAPRVGFAWDPFKDGKTSLRGGFGIYDQLPFIANVGSSISSSYPFLQTGAAANLPVGSFPTEAYQLVVSNGANHRVAYVQQHPGRSYVMEWSLNADREILPGLTALVGYVGSHGVHGVTQDDDVDIVLPTLTQDGYLWPSPAGSGQRLNPNVGQEPATLYRNSALYNGLQIQLTKRLTHGFQVQGSYTWSKSIDTASGATVGDQFANGISSLFVFDPRLTRAISDFNVGRVLTINGLWQLPSPHSTLSLVKTALGGWQTGVIFSATDGQPITPLIGGDPLGLNSQDPFGYPSRLRTSGCSNPINKGNVNEYVKLNCFYAPNPLTLLGNAGRNSIIGPGLQDFDYSLVKNTKVATISDSFNVQFRAEFFNILNRSNFSAPIDNETLFDQTGAPIGGAGSIDGTSSTSRQIQFGLKIMF